MIKSLYTSAAGMQAQQIEVDVIANNLANVNTAGFKKSRAHFEDLLYETRQQPGAATATGSGMAGLEIGSGSRLVSTTKVFTDGVTWQTGRQFDLAIDGPGFFELQGPNGERYFTRDGHFMLDGEGNLVNQNGYRLEPALTVPQEATQVSISKDGILSYAQDDQMVELGQLNVIRFLNPSGLSQKGGNLFMATANSGDPAQVLPGTEGAGYLTQGMLERSNVDIANELIALIVAQRAYEINSRSISTADDMLSTVNNMTR